MNVYAMYGVGGLLSISLLFFGMYSMSNVVGKVTYERPDNQVASVVVTSVPSLDDEEDGNVEEEKVEEEVVEEVKKEEPKEELVLAVPEAPKPEPKPEPEPVVEEETSNNANTIAQLQEQVSNLLEQVSAGNDEQTETPAYFVTPNGTKIDANGNIVNDDGTVEESPIVETEQETSSTLPIGYYRLPTGVIMGPGGVIVSEQDLTNAQEAESQSLQTNGSSCFELPNGKKINAYGQPCE